MTNYVVTLKEKGTKHYFTGDRFSSEVRRARRYPSRQAARASATYLKGTFRTLENRSIYVETTLSPVPVRKNPGYRSAVDKYAAELDRADDMLGTFTGRRTKELLKASAKQIRAGLVVGTLIDVTYEADRGDGLVHYRHRFKQTSRPLLISDSDGSQLGIVGGRYEFTAEEGIVDR